mmetsp:Transcript_9582/g.16574  ORF Transcript_9582/g.16574 Transcript_9582/m.16574 type:complete len:113 (+) Transcript_9582:319-657(+)
MLRANKFLYIPLKPAVTMSDAEDDERIPSSTQIEKAAALGNKPHKQLSALSRLLGVNRLLHYIDPDTNPKPKGSYHFIWICHEALGDSFNSLFPKRSRTRSMLCRVPKSGQR